jgi:two-component system response regulator NreC
MSETPIKANGNPIRILLVEDHQIMRQGLRQLISGRSDLAIVGEISDGRSVMDQMRNLAPDLVLMDLHLPSESGVEVTRRIRAEFPTVKVLAFSSDSDLQMIVRALEAGVAGYVLKDNGYDELIHAIQTVVDHRLYLSPEVSEIVIKEFMRRTPVRTTAEAVTSVLTERELLLLRLISEGKRNKEMAGTLNVTVKSVETYRSRLMKKLGCAATADLVRYAVRNGVVQA